MAEVTKTAEELVTAYQDGDETAFSLLVDRLMPMVRGETSRIRTNVSAEADDLAQEALCALHAAAKRYCSDRGASFVTYARVCVRNRLNDASKKIVSAEIPHDDDQLFEERGHDGLTAEDPSEVLVRRAEDAAYIESLKDRLSTLEFRVLMCHLAAYTYEEIASSLGVTTKTVDNALQRVRRKLSQKRD